jgi:hypothetical protein
LIKIKIVEDIWTGYWGDLKGKLLKVFPSMSNTDVGNEKGKEGKVFFRFKRKIGMSTRQKKSRKKEL